MLGEFKRDECPFCEGTNVMPVKGTGASNGRLHEHVFSRQCNDCDGTWGQGVRKTDGGLYTWAHSGEEIRALMGSDEEGEADAGEN